MSDGKTALTPDEKLRAAFAHLINGVDQHILASIFGVNPGRVAEAITAVRLALYGNSPKPGRGRPKKVAVK